VSAKYQARPGTPLPGLAAWRAPTLISGIMNKALALVLVAFVLLLDWAALQDIARGEPDLRLEYLMLAMSVIVVAVILWLAFRPQRRDTSQTDDPR